VALTYTEIEEQKNTRIVVFFLIVVLFYFLTALIVGSLVKAFFVYYMQEGRGGNPMLGTQGIITSLAIAMVAATLHISYSMRNAMARVQANLSAEPLDPGDTYHRQFAKIVDEVNVATGSKYKITPVVIPTVALNAFSMADSKGNALVGATEGLLARLNRQQLQAVVAHEVAHVASGDSLQTTIGCSLFGVFAATAAAALAVIRHGGRSRVGRRDKGAGAIILFMLLLYLVLSVTQFFYRLIRFSLSRDREYRADAIAIRMTRDPISLSEALYKISRTWRGIGHIDQNFSTLFILNPAVTVHDEQEGFLADLMSTHPPIKKRMKLLAEMAHTDVAHIMHSVMKKERHKELSREVTAEPETGGPQWMMRDQESGWQGPFTAGQAMVLGWLTPATWVKPLGSETVMQAKEEALLAPVFDSKLDRAAVSKCMCPTCRQRLIEEDYEGVPVYHCVFCGGMLVDRRKMQRISLRKQKGFDERLAKLANMAQENGKARRDQRVGPQLSPFHCPNCDQEMRRGFYNYQYLIEVDKCVRCSMVWFDKNELEMIQYLIEEHDPAI
jgi:heat shock protein HtpX